MPAALTFVNDRKVFDNRKSATLTNPGGSSQATSYAIKRNVRSTIAVIGGVEVPTIACRWHVWATDLSTFIPCEHGYLTDSDGNKWYIHAVEMATFEERYALDCTLQGTVAGVT